MSVVHFFLFIHVFMHIGSPEGVALLELELVGEENPLENQQEAPEGEVQVQEQLSECLDHTPTSCIKGKPWSISISQVLL